MFSIPISFLKNKELIYIGDTSIHSYSVRVIVSGYSGALIRVRRSSDNAEQDIGSVNGYLDISSLLSFVGANNGFVTKIYDQKGTNTMQQTTTSLQPQIINTGLLKDINSVASIDFISKQLTSISNSTLTGNAAFSLLTVKQDNTTTLTDNFAYLSWGNPSAGASTFFGGQVTKYMGGFYNGVLRSLSSYSIAAQAFNWRYKGTGFSSFNGSLLRINGLDDNGATALSVTPNLSSTTFKMGISPTNTFCNAKISEMVIYNYVVSNSDIIKFENNQMQYFNI